ncbi:hypothetical protein JG688_00012404 [Phytophthora aleatoria]|uniref:Uncharacterized protein n=1 Tax=Phytophthora aleatoria TaxID=2496075 RepID=A0A8J5J2S1_9STRA|nr:hypothetical protein JG688_00012404 [Phytophthora aleatoria]
MDWAEITRQQCALQDHLKNMKLKGDSLPPATISPPTLGGSTAPVKYEPKVGGYGNGMPSCVKNAVRMIQSFYSDKSTVEKSQSFWNASVKANTCLNETARLSVFRECLKGKTGENRWMYSPINEFETPRRGFITSLSAIHLSR